MKDFNSLGIKELWSPFEQFGLTNSFFKLTAPTLISTWVALVILFILVALCNYFFQYKDGLVRYLIILIVKGFMDLTTQTLGFFHYGHCCFILSLFTFILTCNLMGVIPLLEEPTADLNTTLALGIISFLYINGYSIKENGIKGYLAEFFDPFFFMFPLHVMGKISSVISISFRLFGNLLGGSVITLLFKNFFGQTPIIWYGYLLPVVGVYLSIGISLFFGIFEGLIQAFVFSILSLTYLATELAAKEDHA